MASLARTSARFASAALSSDGLERSVSCPLSASDRSRQFHSPTPSIAKWGRCSVSRAVLWRSMTRPQMDHNTASPPSVQIGWHGGVAR